jgi:hypothetical protein
MGLGRVTSNSIHSHKLAQNQQTSWLAQGWSTFSVRKNHEWPRTHKTQHDPDSKETTTFPHIVYSAPPHGSGIWMAFCLGTPKWESSPQMGVQKSTRLGVLQLCGTITSYVNLRSRWSLNRSFSPRQELSNGVLHTTCTQRNWVYSRLSVVGSQIANLTPGLSFVHNLCCRCPNGSCKPILDIYVSIAFQ